MYVELDIANRRSHVREPDDLERFSVRVSEPAGAEALASALGPLGQLAASDHAWINIGALRAASGRVDDPEWSRQFDSMVAYAASKGWVSEAGNELRAHLDFGDETG